MRDSDMVADFQFANEVTPPRLYWLWPGRIPLGRLTLLVGDPGLGKTLLVADIAARISAGLPWPDAPPPQPDTVQYCPEPLVPGEDDGCPLFNRKTSAPAPTDALIEIENPDGTAVQVDADADSPAAPAGGAEVAGAPPAAGQKRICPFAATADLLDCPHRLLPGSPEQLELPFRRRAPLPGLGVVFVCPEDPDSLMPRLAAAGANLRQICIVNGVSPRNHSARAIAPFIASHPHDHTLRDEIIVEPLRLPAHADVIVEAINFFDHTSLVIIDPLQSVLPPPGQAGPDGLFAALAALAEIAREKGVAIVGIGHLAKARYLQTLYRVQGSVSLIGAARAAHLLSADPDQQDRRTLFPIKTVYSKPPEPIAFRIVAPGRVEWETAESAGGRRVPHLSSELLNTTPETQSSLAEACDWLATYLEAGPQQSRQIQRDAIGAGISARTLRRAKRLLAVRSVRLPKSAGWQWSAGPTARGPESTAPNPKSPAATPPAPDTATVPPSVVS
jgi:hypothetical protein